jgi:urease accessory protein
MPWNASLSLRYSTQPETGRTLAQFEHDGPLRLLKSLYPEGPGICHGVVVHPPGGLVAGDVLDIAVRVEPGAHALISTPGATRFYKSASEVATQRVSLSVAAGARLEWLPLETIAYPHCLGENRLNFELADAADSQLMLWDCTSYGLAASGQPFDEAGGSPSDFFQSLVWPGHWRDEGRLRGDDARLLDSPLGLGGLRCLGSLVMAQGQPFARADVERWQDALRESWADGTEPGLRCGVTLAHPQVLVLRCLGPNSEVVMRRLKAAWALLRTLAWGLPADAPRIWSV